MTTTLVEGSIVYLCTPTFSSEGYVLNPKPIVLGKPDRHGNFRVKIGASPTPYTFGPNGEKRTRSTFGRDSYLVLEGTPEHLRLADLTRRFRCREKMDRLSRRDWSKLTPDQMDRLEQALNAIAAIHAEANPPELTK